jgi:hypothetical protein
MTQTRTNRTVQAGPRRLGTALALALALATSLLIAACGGNSSGGGSTAAPGETMNDLATPAASGTGY